MTSAPVDRLLIAAIVDRLIFGSDTTFQVADAMALTRLLPRDARTGFLGRFFGLGLEASFPGGSTRGHAAGVGNVEIRDDKPRTVKFATDASGAIRAGQWKLRWAGRHVEIDQVTDVGPDARSVRLMFDRGGAPMQMVQMVHRQFGPFMIGAYQAWKVPC